jgi:hypothetical protein
MRFAIFLQLSVAAVAVASPVIGGSFWARLFDKRIALPSSPATLPTLQVDYAVFLTDAMVRSHGRTNFKRKHANNTVGIAGRSRRRNQASERDKPKARVPTAEWLQSSQTFNLGRSTHGYKRNCNHSCQQPPKFREPST